MHTRRACEDEGPMPTLNMSKTLTAIFTLTEIQIPKRDKALHKVRLRTDDVDILNIRTPV